MWCLQQTTVLTAAASIRQPPPQITRRHAEEPRPEQQHPRDTRRADHNLPE